MTTEGVCWHFIPHASSYRQWLCQFWRNVYSLDPNWGVPEFLPIMSKFPLIPRIHKLWHLAISLLVNLSWHSLTPTVSVYLWTGYPGGISCNDVPSICGRSGPETIYIICNSVISGPQNLATSSVELCFSWRMIMFHLYNGIWVW